MYSSARLYYIARFTEATLTDPYQTSREWGLTLKNCLSKVQNYTEEKNRGWGGGVSGPIGGPKSFFLCHGVQDASHGSYKRRFLSEVLERFRHKLTF